jgi:hypothetical protein
MKMRIKKTRKLLTEGTARRARLKKIERVALTPNQPATQAPNA